LNNLQQKIIFYLTFAFFIGRRTIQLPQEYTSRDEPPV